MVPRGSTWFHMVPQFGIVSAVPLFKDVFRFYSKDASVGYRVHLLGFQIVQKDPANARSGRHFNILDTTYEGLEPWATLTHNQFSESVVPSQVRIQGLDCCENCDRQRSCSSTDFSSTVYQCQLLNHQRHLRSSILCLAVFVHAQIH